MPYFEGRGDARREQPDDRQLRQRHARRLRRQGRPGRHVPRQHGRRRPALARVRMPRRTGRAPIPSTRTWPSATTSGPTPPARWARKPRGGTNEFSDGTPAEVTGLVARRQPLLERRRRDPAGRPRQPALRRRERHRRGPAASRPGRHRAAALDRDGLRQRQRHDPPGVRAAGGPLRRHRRRQSRRRPGGPRVHAGRRHPRAAARRVARSRRLRGRRRGGSGDRSVLGHFVGRERRSRSRARASRPARRSRSAACRRPASRSRARPTSRRRRRRLRREL